MKGILLWIWQLPQNLIGFILSRFSKAKWITKFNDGTGGTIYFTSNVFNCGVSLGSYIILDYKNYYGKDLTKTVINHEHGHQKQSKYLGWFYLLAVGIPSAIFNNLWDRVFHKKWSSKKRVEWYYNRYPEKWADRLGGVIRNTEI